MIDARVRRLAGFLALLSVLIFGQSVPDLNADVWPQILGPNRDGVVKNLRVVNGWPNGSPVIHWRFPVGSGYAGPVVSGNQIIVFHRVGNKERVESIDRNSGKSMWRREFDTYYRGGYNDDLGPRCVPLIVDDRIIVLGATGSCHAVKLHGGDHLWSRDLEEEFDVPQGYFGVGSTPVHVDGTIVINLGGKKPQSGMVGLDLQTGHVKWSTTDELASYSSPIVISVDNKKRVFAVTRLNGILLNPNDGEKLLSIPFGLRGATVNAATPLFFDNQVFLTASYGIGAELHQLNGDTARKMWASDDAMSSQYNTPLYYRSHLYGVHGREDGLPAELRCIDAANGSVVWRKKDFGVANLLRAEETIIAVTAKGELVLVQSTPTKYIELGRTRFTEGDDNNNVRAIPAVSQARLYIRDKSELFSIQIGR